jgi:ketosteroid isomerase-like protein
MSRRTTELAERAFAALGRDGPEGLMPYLDPEVEWISIPDFLPDAVDYRSRDGVRRWFADIGEHFDGLGWRLDEVIGGGDSTVVCLTAAGRGRQSGIEMEVQVFSALTIRDDLVVRLESFLRRVQALEAAGLSS